MSLLEKVSEECRKIRSIDLKEFRKSGSGANGTSYDSIKDLGLMMKLYNPDYPFAPILKEVEVAKKVYDLGVPSPRPGTLVTDGLRTGILFERICSKRSYSRMLADEPERVEEFSRDFAVRCKDLHSRECPEGMFPDAKAQFLDLLEKNPWIEGRCHDAMATFISSVPDAGTCLHGDLQFGNAISTLPKGAPLSTPHKFFFIDLGYFSRGCPLFDLGMTQCICLYCDEDFRQKEFHITGELSAKAWDFFLDEYFFGEEHLAERYFGPGQTIQSVSRAIIPYMCCTFLLVGYNVGSMPPHYMKIIQETFGK